MKQPNSYTAGNRENAGDQEIFLSFTISNVKSLISVKLNHLQILSIWTSLHFCFVSNKLDKRINKW